MNLIESDAVLLRRRRFSDHSFVVTWITRDYGKLVSVARSAERPKSPLFGRVDIFSESRVTLAPPKKGDLFTVTEVTPLLSLPALYPTILTAGYFAELIDLFVEPAFPDEDAFLLVQRAWKFLRESSPSLKAVLHFERELASCLGVYDPSQTGLVCLSNIGPRIPRSRPALVEFLNTHPVVSKDICSTIS